MSVKEKLGRKKKEAPGRITAENIGEHREEILAKGKKFKYPLQYSKHRLVINALLIGVVSLVVIATVGYVDLYKMLGHDDIMFKVSQVVPIEVASVDGAPVRFSDYLLQLRSSIAVIERQEGKMDKSEENERRLNFFRRVALDNAQMNTLAQQIAQENGISISRERIEEIYKEHRTSGDKVLEEDSFRKIIRDNYGLSVSEYERLFIELPLLRKEVGFVIDRPATELMAEIEGKLKADGSNFDAVGKEYVDRVSIESTGGMVSIYNIDGDRARTASGMKIGEVSKSFLSRSGDYYYIVKVLNKSDDKVEYVSIGVPLMELANRLETLRGEGKIKEYINIPEQDEE